MSGSASIDPEALLRETRWLSTIGSGETKTIELRPRLAGNVKLATTGKVAGGFVLQVGDDRGVWHWVASKTPERPDTWTHELIRPPGPFRWRVEVWPLDVAPRLRQPRVVEGEVTIEAGKTSAIKVAIPD